MFGFLLTHALTDHTFWIVLTHLMSHSQYCGHCSIEFVRTVGYKQEEWVCKWLAISCEGYVRVKQSWRFFLNFSFFYAEECIYWWSSPCFYPVKFKVDWIRNDKNNHATLQHFFSLPTLMPLWPRSLKVVWTGIDIYVHKKNNNLYYAQ